MHVQIILNADEDPPLKGEEVRDVIRAAVEKVTAIPEGMKSGRTAIAITAHSKEGKPIFLEISLRHLQMAAAAFTARYGEE